MNHKASTTNSNHNSGKNIDEQWEGQGKLVGNSHYGVFQLEDEGQEGEVETTV